MLSLIGFAIRYLPLVVSAVALIEKLVDKNASGADKKAVGVKVLKEILTKFGVTVTPQIETFISQTIDVAVTILNLFGVFKHKEEVEDDTAVVPAEKVAKAARVIEDSPTEARLRELEALIKAE